MMEAIKKTSHLARNIILSVIGVFAAAVITLGIIFYNPLVTLAGGNGNIYFKKPEQAHAYIEKNPELYEILENDGKEGLSYRLKSGLGSLSVSAKDGKVFEVVIIVDTTKITATTADGIIDQVRELVDPYLTFVNTMTLASHGLKEAKNIPTLTTDVEFTIERQIGDYKTVVTKESGSDLVKAVFTR